MSRKAAARTRVIGILACLAVIAGLMAATGTQAGAAAPAWGARAGSAPAPAAPPADTVNLSPDYVNQSISQMEASFGDSYSPVAEAEEITKSAAADEQKAAALATQYQTLNGDISADNQRAATLTAQQDSYASQASSLESQGESLNERIDEHNAEPHDFEVPEQEAAATAYQDEAEDLNSEQSALEAKATTVSDELSQVEDEESQLADDEDSLDEQVDQYNEQVTELAATLRELAGQVQGLLEQMARAEQDAEQAPDGQDQQTGTVTAASPSAAMNDGGDAAVPPQAAEQAVGQGIEDPGGDVASQQPQVAALTQYATQAGTPVITEPGTAVLTPASISGLPAAQAAQLGSPVVSYDGLVREGNGQYQALVVQAPGAALSPQQKALASAVRRGGQAATTVAGVPEFIDALIFVKGLKVTVQSKSAVKYPASARAGTRSPDDKAACLTDESEAVGEGAQANGSGWILNRSRGVDRANQSNPGGGKGIRAEEGIACLTADHVSDTSGTGGLEISGLDDARKAVGAAGLPVTDLARCHVIADILGGKALRQNLFPCYQVGLNIGWISMRSPFETLVLAIANRLPASSGAAVLYTVTPHYKDADSTIPEGVFLTAEVQEPGGVTYPVIQGVEYLENIRIGGGPPLGN